MASLGAVSVGRSATQPNDGFDPNANGIVNVVRLQPDGKILMGGYFTQLHPFANAVRGCAYVARLNHDGTVDTGFSPSANGVVRTMVLQPNGQIILGGQFTTMQGTGSSAAASRMYAARLNADGTLDSAFNPNANGAVYAIAYQANGQIVIGGSFTTVQPNGSAAPVTRNHLARFNVDGSLDTGFDPNADRPVLSLAIEPNGQILVGGGFSKLQPNGAASATTRNCAARLNSDGSLDTGFDPEPNGSVATILVLPNGQIIFGGEFVTVQPNGAANFTQCDFLARLNADGTLDPTYIINPLASVSAVALQTDGKLLVGGNFTQVYPVNSVSATSAAYVIRVDFDGSVDGGFTANPNQTVSAIAVQPDGNVILGGYFTALSPATSPTPILRNYIARVSPYGIPDATLSPDDIGTVYATAALPSGQIMVGGSFLSVSGVSQNFLARLNADGSLDRTYAPKLNGPVQAIALQSNGQIIVGGSFTQVDGFGRAYIARLNPDGTIDGAFNPSANFGVAAIALQSNGQILVGGGFTAFTPNGSTSSYGVNYLARLNADGSIDLTFNPSPSSNVFAITILSDGRILVGGGFTSIAGAARGYMARLLSTGAIDPADFDPEPDTAVYAIGVQSDGKVIIGGGFITVIPQTGIIGTPTTSTGPYGTVVIPAPGTNATTPIYVSHLARLNTDGTLDTTFYPDPSADVVSLAIQGDGKILVGGIMTSFAQNGATTGTIRNYIGRVGTDGTLDSGFNPNANAIVNVVSLLPNGNILIGGSFTTLQPNGASTLSYANHVAILNPNGSLNPSFTSGAATKPSGQVNAMAQLPNGQFIVGGTFGPFSGNQASYLTRFDPDGSPDTAFYSAIDGPINAVEILPAGASTLTATSSAVWLESNGAVRHSFTDSTSGEIVTVGQQSDGSVIIGGQFDNYDGSTNVSNIVRLKKDGTLDTSFHATTNGAVNIILVQPDDKILIGGSFTEVFSTSNAYLARLNSDGSLDTTFAPQPNLQVLGLALQSDGQVIAVGDFTFMAFNTAQSAPANYIARLNAATGALDTTFEPEPNGPLYTIATLPSGQFLVGGSFTTITPNLKTAYNVQSLAIINADGSVDQSFYPDPNAPVSTLVLAPNNQFYVGGTFTGFEQNANITGVTPGPVVLRNAIARLNMDGTVDASFNPNPNGGLTSIAIAANGQIYLGGTFGSIQPNGVGFPVSRSNAARVNKDGTLDPSFDPSINGTVDVVFPFADNSVFVGGNFATIQTGGAYLVGGSFANVSGNASANLTLLNPDGTYNSSYSAHPDGPVNAITSDANGQTLIGGAFANVDGLARANLARVNVDGSLDLSFDAGTNAPVNTMAVQTNGQILVGGAFTSIGGVNEAYIARIGSTGSPDASFAPSVNGTVNSVVIQPNGQIVIGGAFTSVAGMPIAGIARLNPDGSLDPSFKPNPDGGVQAITLQVDGTFYIGGTFTSVGGLPLANTAHILSNGTVDPSFSPSPNGTVNSISVQSDGKVIIAGGFTTAGGLARYDFARFAAATPTTQSVAVSSDQTIITWTRSGGAPAFSSVVFAESTDQSTWTDVGQATTTDGLTWQATGLPTTGSSLYFVRATGVSPSSQFSSSGLVQTIFFEDSLTGIVVNSASSVAAVSGSPFLFTVTATASPKSFTATGLPPGLSINPTTGLISGTPTAAGTYHVTLTVANTGGAVASNLTINVAATGGSPPPATSNSSDRLLNLSSRADLPGGRVLIAGFVVTGTASKTVLIRAVGPGLAAFDVPGSMLSPELELISSSGALISENTGWGGSSSLAAVFSQVGAFALSPTSSDAAMVATLAPGAYTVHVFDPTGTGGVVLAEIYDASPAPLTDPGRLVNISARGSVSPGFGALIGGFVISGPASKGVLIRGVGPGLAPFGVTNAIADPVLKVFDENDNLVAQNTSWTIPAVAGPYQVSASSSDITSADSSVGAFALSAQSADTALIANLPPGSYTFQITSASSATGEALGEVYELP